MQTAAACRRWQRAAASGRERQQAIVREKVGGFLDPLQWPYSQKCTTRMVLPHFY